MKKTIEQPNSEMKGTYRDPICSWAALLLAITIKLNWCMSLHASPLLQKRIAIKKAHTH